MLNSATFRDEFRELGIVNDWEGRYWTRFRERLVIAGIIILVMLMIKAVRYFAS